MKLNEKQVLFTKTLARLLQYAARKNIDVILAEVFRPPEMAKIYAERGTGIAKSVHTKKLAADMYIYKNGTVSWDKEDYRQLGEHWKTLHDFCRWGGDFGKRNDREVGRDPFHFSFEHGGVQ